MDADEVVQVYVQYPSLERMPVKELKAFRRVAISKNGEREVIFKIPVSELKKWNLQKSKWEVYGGDYALVVGQDSQDQRLKTVVKVKGTLK